MTDEEILTVAVSPADAQRIRERFGTERFVMLVPESMRDEIMQLIRHRLSEPDTTDPRHGVYDIPMRLFDEATENERAYGNFIANMVRKSREVQES